MRIVCDTNVLISGILYGGHPREVLERIIEGKLEGVISLAIEQEFRDVLARPKFGLTARQVYQIVRQVRELFQIVFPEDVPGKRIRAIVDDSDDNAVLECAVAAGAKHIVSGDRHLLDLKQFREIQILSPSELLQRTK